MRFAISSVVAVAVVILGGCAEEAAPQAAEKKAEGAAPTLKARLVANKDSYTLPTGGKPLDDYRKLLDGANPRQLPPVPAVDVVLEISNTGDKDLDVNMWSVGFLLELKGPGVVDRSEYSMNCIPPPPVRIKAGETLKMPVRQLSFATGKQSHSLYWTKAGEYELSVSYGVSAAVAPSNPRGPWRDVTLKAGSVKLKVVEGKEGTPIVPPKDDTPKRAIEAVPAKK